MDSTSVSSSLGCVLPVCVMQAARNSVARESAALQEQRAAIQSLLAQLEQREEALSQVRGGYS
jgi:hypothetical protein